MGGAATAMRLVDAAVFVFDVDGTLVLSDDPNAGRGGMTVLPGASEVLAMLRAQRREFVVARRLNTQPGRLVVVGDDLHLEVAMARAAGAGGVLVLTGATRDADLARGATCGAA